MKNVLGLFCLIACLVCRAAGATTSTIVCPSQPPEVDSLLNTSLGSDWNLKDCEAFLQLWEEDGTWTINNDGPFSGKDAILSACENLSSFMTSHHRLHSFTAFGGDRQITLQYIVDFVDPETDAVIASLPAASIVVLGPSSTPAKPKFFSVRTYANFTPLQIETAKPRELETLLGTFLTSDWDSKDCDRFSQFWEVNGIWTFNNDKPLDGRDAIKSICEIRGLTMDYRHHNFRAFGAGDRIALEYAVDLIDPLTGIVFGSAPAASLIDLGKTSTPENPKFSKVSTYVDSKLMSNETPAASEVSQPREVDNLSQLETFLSFDWDNKDCDAFSRFWEEDGTWTVANEEPFNGRDAIKSVCENMGLNADHRHHSFTAFGMDDQIALQYTVDFTDPISGDVLASLPAVDLITIGSSSTPETPKFSKVTTYIDMAPLK